MRYPNPHMTAVMRPDMGMHPQQMQQDMGMQGYPNQQSMQMYQGNVDPRMYQRPMQTMGYPPQQFQQFQPQPFYGNYPQPQFTQNVQNQSVTQAARFTERQQFPSQSQYPQSDMQTTRYQNLPTTEVQEEVSSKPIPFVISPVSHKFSNREISYNTYVNEIKVNNVKIKPGCIASECYQDIIESLIEQAYAEDEVKIATIQNFIVKNTFYKTDIKDIVDNLFSIDVKHLYKTIKRLYKECEDKYVVNVYDKIDNMLTDKINDYLSINAVNSIVIDSFISDFNDLLKIIRNEEEFLEDNLIEYLSSEIFKFIECNKYVEHSNKYTLIPESISLVYIDKHVLETGLNVVEENFVVLENALPNVFLHSLITLTTGLLKNKEIILITLDKSTFKCIVGENDKVYIKAYKV